MRAGGWLIGLTLFAVPSVARSDQSTPKPVTVDLLAGTTVPLNIAVIGTVEGPGRLIGQLEAGWMPKPYAYGINGLLQSYGVYPDVVADLIEEALKNSLVVRPSIGWRPFPKLGFEVLAGYTLLTLNGGISARQIIETVTSRQLPSDTANQIPLHSTLHNVHVELAWRFVFGERLVVRPSLQFLHCVASNSGIDVTPRARSGQRVIDEVNQRLDGYLDGYYTRYVYAPLVGVSAGYRF